MVSKKQINIVHGFFPLKFMVHNSLIPVSRSNGKSGHPFSHVRDLGSPNSSEYLRIRCPDSGLYQFSSEKKKNTQVKTEELSNSLRICKLTLSHKEQAKKLKRTLIYWFLKEANTKIKTLRHEMLNSFKNGSINK